MKRLDQHKFSLEAVLISTIGIALLIAITVVGLSGPLLNAIDDWCKDIHNQLKIFWFLVFVIGCFGVWWFLKRVRG